MNLLPPEILEKRKAEQRWVYVMFGAVGLVVVLVIAYLVPSVMVMQKDAEVRVKQQEADDLRREADRYKIFEDKQADLQARQTVAQTALAGRVAWSRLLSELSLVLPTDLWFDELTLDEIEGLLAKGRADDVIADAPDLGHKTIAKMLVRFSDLDQVSDVWLTRSEKKPDKLIIEFEVKADVSAEPTKTTTPSVPAPPAQPAQNTQ